MNIAASSPANSHLFDSWSIYCWRSKAILYISLIRLRNFLLANFARIKLLIFFTTRVRGTPWQIRLVIRYLNGALLLALLLTAINTSLACYGGWCVDATYGQGFDISPSVVCQDCKMSTLLDTSGRRLRSEHTKHIKFVSFYPRDDVDNRVTSIKHCPVDCIRVVVSLNLCNDLIFIYSAAC